MKTGSPFSDLTKEITHKGYNNDKPFIPTDVLGYELDYKGRLGLFHLLHFDTCGLIEKGEAIDVNTLDKNPYSV